MKNEIAQLVEQRTGNAEVTGSNPVEALIFFRLLLSNCLNWKIYCDDHSSLSSKELQIAQTAQINHLFQLLNLTCIYGDVFYRLACMLMSKQVNNDSSGFLENKMDIRKNTHHDS